MKSLVVSLMRLGDLIMMRDLLLAYKRDRKMDLHVLVYKELEFCIDLFPFVDQWHFIDRMSMQESGKSLDLSILDNIYQLDSLVQNLKTYQYKSLVSLSHNKVSHHLLSVLAEEDQEIIGSHELEGEVLFGSPWIKYLNDFGGSGDGGTYHLLDIYKNALGLKDFSSSEIDPNLFYGNEYATPMEDYICVQISSNEEKKTFSHKKWAESFEFYRLLEPTMKILVLGAPSEKEMLEEFKEKYPIKNMEVVACSLKNAKALIARAKMLVTPDTSIKHLAMGTDTKIFEISLGSSQVNLLGAFSANSLILSSKQACSPCSHSSACPYERFRCQDDMPADVIGFSMAHYQVNHWAALDTLATEFTEELNFYRTYQMQNLNWTCLALGVDAINRNIANLLHQAAWNIVLSEEALEDWQRFDGQARDIYQFLIHNDFLLGANLPRALERCESMFLGYELETQELIQSLKEQICKEPSGIYTKIENWFDRSIREDRGIGAFAAMYSSSNHEQEDRKSKNTQAVLGNLNHLFKIERKLSEILRIDFMEAL